MLRRHRPSRGHCWSEVGQAEPRSTGQLTGRIVAGEQAQEQGLGPRGREVVLPTRRREDGYGEGLGSREGLRVGSEISRFTCRPIPTPRLHAPGHWRSSGLSSRLTSPALAPQGPWSRALVLTHFLLPVSDHLTAASKDWLASPWNGPLWRLG